MARLRTMRSTTTTAAVVPQHRLLTPSHTMSRSTVHEILFPRQRQPLGLHSKMQNAGCRFAACLAFSEALAFHRLFKFGLGLGEGLLQSKLWLLADSQFRPALHGHQTAWSWSRFSTKSAKRPSEPHENAQLELSNISTLRSLAVAGELSSSRPAVPF